MFSTLSFNWYFNPFVFYMGVNSITALKLSAIVPRILKKKLSFLDSFYVCAVAVYLYLMSILWQRFQSNIFKGKRYENCSNVLWRVRGTKQKWNLIKSDFQRVRGFLLSFYFRWSSVVVLCKKGKLTTRIKYEKVS